jgi:uncharacterized membrane protein
MDTNRAEAFSDGVFAVAITLLALDLSVAGPGHGSLAHQLREHWPSFAAYVISFFVIGITWVNHHALFKSFARADRTLLFLNLLLLLFIVAIPFATSTVATYLSTGGADAHLAAAISAGSTRAQNRHVPLPPAAAHAAALRFGLGSIVYLVAIAVAFASAPAALGLIAAVAVYYVFEQTPSTD